MCVMSMVHDQFDKVIPWVEPWQIPTQPSVQPFTPYKPVQTEDIAKLIRDYKEAMELAKRLDELTMQPDCEDPKKAETMSRAEKLEQLLKDGSVFEVKENVTLEPGKYRVIDGKLYRAVE